jgi:cell division protein FtsB
LIRPVLLYRVEAAEISKVDKELKQLKAENEKLRAQTQYLRTAKGAQTEARKLGFVYPGEVSIVIEQKPANND